MVERFAKVLKSIGSADEPALAGVDGTGVLTGFSGKKALATLQGCLQAFPAEEDVCYVEVGVFQGLTLLATAAACPTRTCIGIDNFVFSDPRKENQGIIESRAKALDVDNFEIIDKDYEDALTGLAEQLGPRKVGVYFVDGPHDYRSQLMCLLLALPHLHEHAVVIVDDSNYRHVRQANADFLTTHPDWTLLAQAYTPCHPTNMTAAQKDRARAGWWNGINVLVRDPERRLPRRVPPTKRSRDMYVNSHVTWSSTLSDILPESVDVMRALYQLDPVRFAVFFARFQKAAWKHRRQNKGLFKKLNTFSGSLPEFDCARVD